MNNFLISDNQRLVFPWWRVTPFHKVFAFQAENLASVTGKRNHVKTYQNCDQLTAGLAVFGLLQLTSGGLFFNALKMTKKISLFYKPFASSNPR